MKKILTLVIALAAFAAASQAQDAPRRHRVVWFDFQLAEQVGINQWSEAGFVSDRLPRTSLTEFRAVFNVRFPRYLGIFTDMGVGFMPASPASDFNLASFPGPARGGRYFLKEEYDNTISSEASAHFKMTWGFFGHFPTQGKFDIKPYVGVGFLTMATPRYSCVIKEENTNMMYRADYMWLNDDSYSDGTALGYLTGRLNFAYRLNRNTNLLFGFEYTWIFDRADFYADYTNTFNGNVYGSYYKKGNRMNMLGLSVGVSFR